MEPRSGDGEVCGDRVIDHFCWGMPQKHVVCCCVSGDVAGDAFGVDCLKRVSHRNKKLRTPRHISDQIA